MTHNTTYRTAEELYEFICTYRHIGTLIANRDIADCKTGCILIREGALYIDSYPALTELVDENRREMK